MWFHRRLHTSIKETFIICVQDTTVVVTEDNTIYDMQIYAQMQERLCKCIYNKMKMLFKIVYNYRTHSFILISSYTKMIQVFDME